MGKIFDFIAVLVASIWGIGMLVSFVRPEMQLNPAIYALMTAIIGAYTSIRLIQRNGNGKR